MFKNRFKNDNKGKLPEFETVVEDLNNKLSDEGGKQKEIELLNVERKRLLITKRLISSGVLYAWAITLICCPNIFSTRLLRILKTSTAILGLQVISILYQFTTTSESIVNIRLALS